MKGKASYVTKAKSPTPAGMYQDEPVTYDQVVGYPHTRPNFGELGRSGIQRYGNWVYEEFLPDLRWPKAAKIYQEMSSNDPTIGAIFYMAEQLIRKASWRVIPASEEMSDREIAEFVDSCMNDMNQTWADFICESLSMFTYGWSFHEIIYKIRRGPTEKDGKFRSKYKDGRIGWRGMPGRSQHTLWGWDFAKDGGAVGLIQMAPPTFEQVHIPFSKGLLFRTKVSRNNPEGRSLLRNAYRPWYFKKRIEEVEGIGIERDLAGLPVLQPPENVNIWDDTNPDSVALKAQAENLVRNIRRDASEGVVIPFGWDLQLMSTGGSRQFDTNAIINRYDQRIAITMLSDIVMLGADKVGSFALADVKKSLLSTALEALVQSIADTINNYAIPPLMEINAIDCPNGYPQVRADNIEAPDMEKMGKFLQSTGIPWHQDAEIYNVVRRILDVSEVSLEQFDEVKADLERMRQEDLATKMKFGQEKEEEEDGKSKDNKTAEPGTSDADGDAKQP